MAGRRLYVRLGERAIPVGELVFNSGGGRETSVFRYDQSWIEHPGGFALAPSMPLDFSPFHFSKDEGSALPPPLADGTPDSWGRAIIKASLGGRFCTELDFLLQSADFLRSGALRYYETRDQDAPALAAFDKSSGDISVPRLVDLGKFIIEARSFEADPARYREKRADIVGGNLLKDAVGSLGGARPKINARDDQDVLWIVKLAKMDDRHSVAHAEVLALKLAKEVGLTAAEARVMSGSPKFPITIVRRFDRDPATKTRLPFISAQTFMDLRGTNPGNYADIAFRLSEWSADPVADKLELFKRVAFNILIQNTDDHLRNLGFLYGGDGKWRLAPAFDVNPNPDRGATLKTSISQLHGNGLSIDNLMEAAPFFDIDVTRAGGLIFDMATIIRTRWRELAAQLNMPGRDVRYIAPAFENPQMTQAIALTATRTI